MKEIALNILDIVENSVQAGAKTVWITIRESENENLIFLSIMDDGPGIPAEILDEISDPFFTSRSVQESRIGAFFIEASCGTHRRKNGSKVFPW